MPPAIRAENVSKCYHVGLPAVATTLTDTVRRQAGAVRRKVRQLVNPAAHAADGGFWALKDVSFEAHPGEVVGVIGRNGAGKSTLLKLLSRITVPTRGRIELRGRLGSLLEVGTGFHPELTGRENVFLMGSVLGMSRREVKAKFDQIVDFSEIGRHLDTPVKWYSSGMYVRLGFAVAAHLEPEILIVDEVLAVGDATFQRRVLDRMAELGRRGLTILFVSHNMQHIPRLCQRAVYLKQGQVVAVGDAGAVTRQYLDHLLADTKAGDLRDKPRSGDGRAKFVRAGVVDSAGRPAAAFVSGTDLVIRLDIEASTRLADATAAVAVQTLFGTRVLTGWTPEANFPVALDPGATTLECRFDRVALRPGQTVVLNLQLATASGVVVDAVDNAVVLDVVGGADHAGLATAGDQGVWVCPVSWSRL
jgi:lipopolysaccharide transport system ATP-binding protein